MPEEIDQIQSFIENLTQTVIALSPQLIAAVIILTLGFLFWVLVVENSSRDLRQAEYRRYACPLLRQLPEGDNPFALHRNRC